MHNVDSEPWEMIVTDPSCYQELFTHHREYTELNLSDVDKCNLDLNIVWEENLTFTETKEDCETGPR